MEAGYQPDTVVRVSNVVRPLKDLIALIEKDLPKQKWELVD